MFMQFKAANTYIDNELFPDDPSFTPVDPDPNGEGIYVTLDQQDGYEDERRTITQMVRDEGIQSFVTITGDIRSYLAGQVHFDYDQPANTPGNQPVGVKLVCGSVTSSNLTELASLGRGRVPQENEFTWATTVSNKYVKYFTPTTTAATWSTHQRLAAVHNGGPFHRRPEPGSQRQGDKDNLRT